MINNFYFLALDYLESWLNLVIVSLFVLDSRQVGEVWNREPQTRWLSINARPDTLSLNFIVYWVKIFENLTQNSLSQNCVNLLHFYHTQSSVQTTITKVEKNFKSWVYSLESQNKIWSTPTILWAADFFWPGIDRHSPVVSFYLIINSKTGT